MSEEQTPEQWQTRYEVAEEEWRTNNEQLRRLISRLSIAAEGQDETLDRQLEELRNAVREKVDDGQLKVLMERISASLAKIDERPLPAHHDDPRAALIHVIQRLRLPAALDEEASALKRRLLDDDEPLDLLTDELAALIDRALNAPGSDKPGLLSRLLERNQEEKRSAQEGTPPPPTGPSVNLALVSLLEKLSIPLEFADQAKALKSRLVKGGSDAEWNKSVDELVSLIASMAAKMQAEKRELEGFVQQIIERLHQLDDHLRGAEELRHESVQSGRALDAAVKDQMRGMNDSVQRATELDQLKRDVKERMEAISNHMISFRRMEEERNKSAESEVKNLKSRMQNLEDEAQQLRRKVREEHQRALHDPLTGLYNRLALDEHVQREFSRWQRYATPLSLLIVDLDHFKRINDSYGHTAGDMVLKRAAVALQTHLRQSDILARFGGEEFVALLPETELEAARQVGEKIREAVAEIGFHHHGQPVSITTSVGVTQYRSGDTHESAFERADTALYQAKEGGRNRCMTA